MSIKPILRSLAPISLGLGVSSAHEVGIVAALMLLPAFTFWQPSRRMCYAAATGYFVGALWPLAVGAKNFFGPDISVVGAMAFWALCAMLLAVPYALLWTNRIRQVLWRAPVALLIGAIPPLGLIGFASPLTASGFLFPAWSWAGLAVCLVGCGLIAAYPVCGVLAMTAVALVANVVYRGDPKPPSDWQAVDTCFGAISHGPATPLRVYLAAQTMLDQARASSARVVVFPESVVPSWTASTDLFWKPAVDALVRDHKIVLIGALIPESVPLQGDAYGAAVDLLRATHDSPPAGPQAVPPHTGAPYCYRNAVIIKGAESGIFLQRVPVPISAWKPLSRGGAPLNLAGPAVLKVAGQRAAVLVCYEQILPWTVWTAAVARPTLIVGMSNDHWATGIPIRQWQALCLHAWSRLFRVPYLVAVNT